MWAVLAIAAAILWGISYSTAGEAFKRISVPSLLFVSALVSTVFMFIYAMLDRSLSTSLAEMAASRRTASLVLIVIVSTLLANVFVSHAIAGKNATAASIIEITYPFFVAVFALVFFKQAHLSLPMIAGGVLVFAGTAIITIFTK